MAAERSRRKNAGSRMNQMLEEVEEDDFYKTTYGGFKEEADDNDYRSEESESESTDSDFSIDENDAVHSDAEDDEPKRKKRVITKAYTEPKREPAETKPKVEEKKEKKKVPEIPGVQIYTSPERKSLRKSTALKSKQVQSRQKIREEQAKILADIADKKNINVEDMRRLTQEELLAEAKITEQLNLKSLETYERLELEKKRTRVHKHVYRGPVIRYHSVSMPLLMEQPCVDPEINVDGDGDGQADVNSPAEQKQSATAGENCSRTFITFTDEATFNSIFPQHRRKHPQRLVCPVTRLPAKYIDPITQTPYTTIQAFRLIRDAYAKQLAQGEGSKVGEAESRDSTPSPVSATPAAAQQKRKVQSSVAVTVAE